MLTLQPEILQAMVVGDRRPYLVGVIVARSGMDRGMGEGRAASRGTPAALRDDPDYQRALSAAVDRVNADLSVIEKVRRFILADEPFSTENEQLTPSIKIRRHVIRAALWRAAGRAVQEVSLPPHRQMGRGTMRSVVEG